jgi:MarR family transcriptional regulator, transcriptional regulator for hemolysin
MNRRHELLSRLERVGPGLRRRWGGSERHAEFLTRFGGVTLYQVGALRHLVKHGPLTMNELAARMEISPSSATQLVDRLVHHGLVVRNPDPDDRRVLRVAASGPALEAVRGFEKDTSERLETLLAPLTDDELEVLASLAERIADEVAAAPACTTHDVPAGGA